MVLIIAYAIFNIVISHYLEKRKWRSAVIAHAVLFTVFPFCVLFLFPVGDDVALLAQSIFGREHYIEISALIGDGGEELIIPMIAADVAFFVMFAATAAVITERVVKFFHERIAEEFCQKNDKDVYAREITKEKSRSHKIYLKNCRLLC